MQAATCSCDKTSTVDPLMHARAVSEVGIMCGKDAARDDIDVIRYPKDFECDENWSWSSDNAKVKYCTY